MDDNEARYLIDQFNRYSSWRARGWESYFSLLAVVIAANALYLSSLPPEQRLWPWWAIVAFCFAACAIVADSWSSKTRRSYAKRLTLLEDYRSRHKLPTSGALPDSVTFKTIIESKPEQLEKVLKEVVSKELKEDSAPSTRGPTMGSDEVRCSLLDHYSSQTQAHVIELLTLALVGLGLVQFAPQLSALGTITILRFAMHLDRLALALVSGGLSSLGIRTVLRTFYWGYLSSAILYVPKKKGEELLEKVKDDWIDTKLETYILHSAAVERVRQEHTRIHWLTQKVRWWFWILVAFAMWGLIFLAVS